ncbi:FkbM family methyltransferase [Nitratireductor aquimarinus]|uniref:FkbM family methyltransferase n=1 Tax=Nitratireductor aquimarinus TaxID=889300 RepID=UPI00398F1D21
MKFDYNAVFKKRQKSDDGSKIIKYPHTSGPISIAVADGIVSNVIQKKIEDGRYEKHEAKTVAKILDENEVFLELGAGVGVISTLAWLTGKVREVHCYEADPRLIPLIKATHRENGVQGQVHNVILTNDEDALQAESVDFHIREHFYGNSTITSVGREVKETLKIPVQSINDAIKAIQPTVIACDIEGGELGLFDDVEMPSVKKIMLETHQSAIKGSGMRQVFHEMHKADFHYDERFSSGSVSVFTKIE